MKKINILLVALFSFLSLTAWGLPRPPQYIAIAFDNCNEPEVWQEVRDFSNKLKEKKVDAKFTFFLSGTFFVTSANKNSYKSPAFPPCIAKCADGASDCNRKCHGAGSTSIGWAKDLNYLKSRIQQINAAISEGHEMGSHAVSHWSGAAWTQSEWQAEMDAFFKILSNPGAFNGAPAGFPTLNLKPSDFVGFRAPYLDTNKNMYAVLKKNFRYDTSQTSDMSDWPTKTSYGMWDFPLGELPVRNRGRKVLSMDYNFYAMQSKAQPEKDPHKIKAYEDEMVDTYLNYFWTNYTGNRAPLHIGHHFTPYQSGAYWRALKRFAADVCARPEVRCVTYKTLASELDKLSADTIKAFQRRQFEAYVPKATVVFNRNGFEERTPASVSREELKKHTCPASIEQVP